MLAWIALLSSIATQDAPVEPVPATRLVYVPAQKFAEQCPTKLEVEAGIADRIGSSPFSEPAARVVVLSLDGDATATKAKVELFDADLKPLGERNLESGGGCQDLVEAAELAISIALAPSLALGQRPPPPVPPPPPPVPTPIEPRPVELPAEAKAKEPEPPKEKPFHLLLGGGVDAGLWIGPDPVVGPSISLAIRTGDIEVRLERHERVFPGIDTKLGIVDGAGVATIAPCAHYPLFSVVGDGDAFELSGCPTASVGEAWAIGAYIGPGPYLGAGGRVGAEWMQANLASFRLWGQVEYSVQKAQFKALDGRVFWPGPEQPVTLQFGLAYEVPINF